MVTWGLALGRALGCRAGIAVRCARAAVEPTARACPRPGALRDTGYAGSIAAVRLVAPPARPRALAAVHDPSGAGEAALMSQRPARLPPCGRPGHDRRCHPAYGPDPSPWAPVALLSCNRSACVPHAGPLLCTRRPVPAAPGESAGKVTCPAGAAGTGGCSGRRTGRRSP